MLDNTYAPGLRKLDTVEAIATDAKVHWPDAPAACLRAHVAAMRKIFATLPAVSRRTAQGRRFQAAFADIDAAIAMLEREGR